MHLTHCLTHILLSITCHWYWALLSILLKAYSDVPPMYFPIPGHLLISKNISLSCPPHCIGQYRGGHEISLFLLISGTLSFQALIKLITMWKLCVWLGRIGKYHLNSEKLGFNMDREPQARGPYWTPISKNEDGISQYVRARRTVFTLLSI